MPNGKTNTPRKPPSPPNRWRVSQLWERGDLMGILPLSQSWERGIKGVRAETCCATCSDWHIYPVWGKPMLYWTIQACKKSRYIDRYFVSTEDAEIKTIARSCAAELIDRPSSDAILKASYA